MKQNDIKVFCASLIFVLLAIGCSSSGQQEKHAEEQAPPARQQPEKAKEININSKENAAIATVLFENEKIYVRLLEKELFGEKTRSDKRKYYDGNDAMQYAVKYSEEGFKLRDSNEQLLWKVKFNDTGIKLSGNEEMDNPYKVSASSEGKIKVKKDDQELASMRFNPSNGFVSIQDKYYLNGFEGSLAMGILLIDEIPEEQRIMLCAEVVAAGK